MACWTQKDFYEASQLHLFRSASIKLAEALAQPAWMVTALASAKTRDAAEANELETNNNRKKKKNGRKNAGEKHVLLRQTSERLRVVYLCAVRLLISAN